MNVGYNDRETADIDAGKYDMSLIALLSGLPGLMVFLFLIGAIVYTVRQPVGQNSAKSLMLLGLCILLFLRVARLVFNFLVIQYAMDDFAVYNVVYSLVATMFYMLALGLIISAAFTRRSGEASEATSDGPLRRPETSKNPYTSPVS